MLNKLLGNLPFNPGLIDQVAFYGKRMRDESSIRRIGFGFASLALAVQLFAVISPPQPSLAASNNDLINGGFSSAAEAASDCRSNIQGYQTILANYGITCDRVASANTLTIRSTDWSKQLFSMGRLPYNIAGETPVTVASQTLYVRYLWGWDTGAPSAYQALNVTSPGGQTFLLLYNCGNLTSVGMPVPVQQPPKLSIPKSMTPGYPVAGSTVDPGTVLSYRIYINNTGGPAQNVVLKDTQPAYTTYKAMGGGADHSGYNTTTHTASWSFATVPAGTVGVYFDEVKFTVNANTPDGTQICNVAHLSANGVATLTSNAVCVKVKVNAPAPPITPKSPPPTPTCANGGLSANSPECKPCSASLSSEDTIACVQIHKTAANLTQNISDANGTTAQAGDVIKYTLSATNTGKATVKKYIFQENLSDVLDYATVQDLNGGALDNATLILSWPSVDIAAGQTVQKSFTVQVKDPIPTTAPSTSDPMHFDHIMTNIYGNTVSIHLPETVIQASVQTTEALPNTGPGSSLLIGFGIFLVGGYFLARSRLLAKETQLITNEYTTTGGI